VLLHQKSQRRKKACLTLRLSSDEAVSDWFEAHPRFVELQLHNKWDELMEVLAPEFMSEDASDKEEEEKQSATRNEGEQEGEEGQSKEASPKAAWRSARMKMRTKLTQLVIDACDEAVRTLLSPPVDPVNPSKRLKPHPSRQTYDAPTPNALLIRRMSAKLAANPTLRTYISLDEDEVIAQPSRACRKRAERRTVSSAHCLLCLFCICFVLFCSLLPLPLSPVHRRRRQ
jgi:hypothetical protein